MEYTINPERWADKEEVVYTGIYVRALSPEGKYESVDIYQLDKASLLNWLRSRGGKNEWAENCVGVLLGYGNLIEEEK
jgi:hypothetical protein